MTIVAVRCPAPQAEQYDPRRHESPKWARLLVPNLAGNPPAKLECRQDLPSSPPAAFGLRGSPAITINIKVAQSLRIGLKGDLQVSPGRSDRPDGQFCQASLRTCCGVVLGRSLREKCPRAVATIQMGRAFGIPPRARDPIQSRSGSALSRWESAKRLGQPVRRTCCPALDIAVGQTRRAEELRHSSQSDGPKYRQFGFEPARPPIPTLRLSESGRICWLDPCWIANCGGRHRGKPGSRFGSAVRSG